MFDLFSRAWHRRDIRKRVQRYGWTALYVGDYESLPSWAYTIGFLDTVGAPEVVVFDMPIASANSFFWEIFRDLQNGALVIRDGERWGDPGEEQCCWRRVHPNRLADDEQPWLAAAQNYHAGRRGRTADFEAFQLVLPDQALRLPWETGYDENLRPRQRELYLPQERSPARLAEAAAV